MNSKALKFVVSALAIGATMVACKPAANASRPASAAAKAQNSEAGASAAFAKAQAAVKAGALDVALGHAETAVELSPRDLGYRMLLADLYLKDGRFQSAEATFEDVLTLDPSNVRAGLSVALTRIALGRQGGAIAQLDEMPSAPPADLGLAYALAGEHGRAIEILELAARSTEASARVRQNLALAYALSGDWQKARTTAGQDVSADQLGARLEQWAKIAQPRESWDQVAALLGVSPKADDGQPLRLALAREADGVALAAAAPAEPAPALAAAPVRQVAIGGPAAEAASQAQFAEAPAAPVAAAPMAEWVSADPAVTETAPPSPDAEEADTRPVYAAAVESLVTPQAPVLRASAPAAPAPRIFDRAPKAKPALRAAGAGRFAVQLGAFASATAVERAWASAYKRYGFTSHTPLSTTVKLPKGTFHRLSVAGFASHADAARVCQTVKAKGGVCFVRSVAGDAPVQWAARYAGRRA
jgi:Flp pilus assembly protein TadD